MKLAFTLICFVAVLFMGRVLFALVQEWRAHNRRRIKYRLPALYPRRRRAEVIIMQREWQNRSEGVQLAKRGVLVMVLCAAIAGRARGEQADTMQPPSGVATQSTPQQIPQEVLDELEAMRKRIDQLEAQLKQQRSGSVTTSLAVQQQSQGAASVKVSPAAEPAISAADRDVLNALRETTINVSLDTYYAYNFNHPVGARESSALLRCYSNEFSLNQASVNR